MRNLWGLFHKTLLPPVPCHDCPSGDDGDDDDEDDNDDDMDDDDHDDDVDDDFDDDA